MSEFKKYNTEELKKYADALSLNRKISLVQLHHTYSPAYKQFNGKNHIELQTGMRNYHIKTNGWSDIAQHFTVFPDGIIVSGRSMEMIPAGIKGGNTGAICIECLGNFDSGGDKMTEPQKNAIVGIVKIFVDKFSLNPANAVVYHGWYSADGKKIGNYQKSKSVKSCPGTEFFGGNTKEAFEKNLLPLITNYKAAEATDAKTKEIRESITEICKAGVITNEDLWIKKCGEDVNVYWLCRKMADYIKNK